MILAVILFLVLSGLSVSNIICYNKYQRILVELELERKACENDKLNIQLKLINEAEKVKVSVAEKQNTYNKKVVGIKKKYNKELVSVDKIDDGDNKKEFLINAANCNVCLLLNPKNQDYCSCKKAAK